MNEYFNIKLLPCLSVSMSVLSYLYLYFPTYLSVYLSICLQLPVPVYQIFLIFHSIFQLTRAAMFFFPSKSWWFPWIYKGVYLAFRSVTTPGGSLELVFMKYLTLSSLLIDGQVGNVCIARPK